MKKYTEITQAELQALAIGANILGSGGGGDTAFLLLMAQRMFQHKKPVKLIQLEDLQPDDLIVPVAHIGAPLVEQEKMPNGKEFIPVFKQIEKQFGKKPTALMAGEIGGANGLTPFIVAQQLDLPVLDADGMGRAFPELQMCSFFLSKVEATPTFIASNSGTTVTITTEKPNQNIENIARNVTVAFGSNAVMAIYTMHGQQAQSSVIAGTVSQAINIGQTILHAQTNHEDPVQALCHTTNATLLTIGTIVDIEQKIDQGFLKGTVAIQNHQQQTCTIQYQNENLIAHINETIVATTPDIIAIIDTQSGRAITSEALRFGIEVAVVVIPSPTLWTTPEGLRLVGPQYFGYDTTYKPCSYQGNN